MTTSMTQRVATGVRVTFGATILSGLVQAMTMVLLARLLTPADYGAYAVVLAITSLTTGFVAGALERTLIVEQQVSRVERMLLPVGLATWGTAAVALAGLWLAIALFNVEVSLGLFAMMLAAQLVGSLAIVPRVLMRRRFAFGTIAISELFGQVLGTAMTATILAWIGFGAYALAGGAAVQSLVATSILVMKTRPTTATRHFFEDLRQTIPSACQLSKSSSLEIVNGQMPAFVIGGSLGTVPLGNFNRGYSLVQLPIQLLTNSMSRVMVSGLVAVAGEPERLLRGLRSLVLIAAALITPIAFGIAGSHEQFTAVVLGPKWASVAMIIPSLALFTWSTMLAHLFGVLMEASRHLREKVRVQAVATMVLLVAMVAGSGYGLAGATIGMAAAGVVLLALYMALAARITNTSPWLVVGWLLPGIGAGIVCCFYALALSWYSPPQSAGMILLLQIAGCGVLTLSYYFVFCRALLKEIVRYCIPALPLDIRPRGRGI